MSRIIKVDKYPYKESDKVFLKSKVEIKPGVTVLVGCNGAGKSTFITDIKESLVSENIPYISFDNLREGGNTARQLYLNKGKIPMLAALATSSEGEQISINISELAADIGKFCGRNKGATELWILLDAIDSGLSIDNIVEIKQDLFSTILAHNSDSDVYIVVSANTFEMCLGEQCLDVRKGKYRKFKSYTAYRNFVLKSREHKDQRFPTLYCDTLQITHI